METNKFLNALLIREQKSVSKEIKIADKLFDIEELIDELIILMDQRDNFTLVQCYYDQHIKDIERDLNIAIENKNRKLIRDYSNKLEQLKEQMEQNNTFLRIQKMKNKQEIRKWKEEILQEVEEND